MEEQQALLMLSDLLPLIMLSVPLFLQTLRWTALPCRTLQVQMAQPKPLGPLPLNLGPGFQEPYQEPPCLPMVSCPPLVTPAPSVPRWVQVGPQVRLTQAYRAP